MWGNILVANNPKRTGRSYAAQTDRDGEDYEFGHHRQKDRAATQGDYYVGQTARHFHQGMESEDATMTERGNEILAAMPSAAMAALQPHLTLVTFAPDHTVHETGELITQVYFPSIGAASLQIITSDGRSVDTALVGRESILGPMAVFGPYQSTVRCITRTTLVAHRISAVDLRRVAAQHDAISRACIDYNDALLSLTQRGVARCHCVIDVRLPACLLHISDLLGSHTVPIAQERLGDILSVRRTSVTDAARRLKDAGLISYSRGTVKILDRVGLLSRSLAH
jgi:CRP-like cAMP-binding protein